MTPDQQGAALLRATDRAALSARLWEVAEHTIVAEWICCEPLDPTHHLCAKGYAALEMAKSLLVDSDPEKAWNPAAPLLDAVLAEIQAASSAAAQPEPAAVRAGLREQIAAVLRPHASLGGTPPRYEVPFFDGATPSLPRISGWKPLDEVVDALAAVLPATVDRAAVLREEAARIRAHCPDHLDSNSADGSWMVCHCAVADDLDLRLAVEAQQQTEPPPVARIVNPQTGVGFSTGGNLPAVVPGGAGEEPAHETRADWIDGHPQLEAIASAVYERCETGDGGIVHDDPRNIAVAALAAVLPPDTVTAEPVKPTSRSWTFEVCYEGDKWHGCGGTYDDSVFDNAHETAQEHFQHRAENDKQRRKFRMIRATTTYAIEAEHQPATGPAGGAQQPKTPPTVGYSGKGRVWCLRCPHPADEDVPVTGREVSDWEICASCGRHVLDVARWVDERAAAQQPKEA